MDKSVLLVCVYALICQSVSAQCLGALYEGYGWEATRGTPWGYASYAPVTTTYAIEGLGYAPATLSASNGGGFAVNSISPMAPTGVFVTSENAYEGPVAVTGHVPFLGAIALEGQLPTLGAGAVSYGCGAGGVAITNEGVPALGYNTLAGPYGYAEPYGYNGYGYGGCGYGMY